MYISSLSISGYRSLKDVRISGMLPVCIFHGPNNSGKSNILSALETIFRRKLLIEETTIGEITKHERQGSFWQGRITHFRDNFHGGRKKDITFEVSVTLTDGELNFLHDILKQLHRSLGIPTGQQGAHNKVLTLSGRITYVDEDTADFVLEKAVFNRVHLVFEKTEQASEISFQR